MPSKTKFLCLPLVLLAAGVAPAAAQDNSDAPVVYSREVFVYQSTARPDPFRSLLNSADLSYRFEDLELLGVIYHPDPQRSVAILSSAGSDRRIHTRVGERLGGITILGIQPRRVDVLVSEFGVTRRESLELKTQPQQGTGS